MRPGPAGWAGALVALAVAALLAGSCSGGDGADAAGAPAASTTTLASTSVAADAPVFTGDPDSEFCQLSRAAADRPVLNPFEAGLEPREVELRFRALSSRFQAFHDVAPEPLADDLDQLVATFDDFARVLQDAGYDFGRLAQENVDVSAFNDPALRKVADRLAAYQEQVCRKP